MKKILFLLAALAYAGLGSAQSIEADTLPTLPPHVYCETTACCSISGRRPKS